MIRIKRVWMGALALAGMAGAASADAQTLGTFRWQLRPYCNVLTVTVTAVEGTYRLEGTDDQCGGAADKASAIGTAFPNPDGTIGFGLTIVATPGGIPVHVDAALAPGQFNGTWRDSAGGRGDFVLTPGAGSGGNARPLPSSQVPATIGLRPDGSIVATGVEGGPIPASGGGIRMMWHGGKAAFRAGFVDGTDWDEAAVGIGSVAFGLGGRASGEASFSAGDGNTASGIGSTAFGRGSLAQGAWSLAVGRQVDASGQESAALGVLSRASGPWAFAVGNNAAASGAASIALGLGVSASAAHAFTAGVNTAATGRASVALGESVESIGTSAVALGYNVRGEGDHSVILGANAQTTTAGRGSFVFGDASPGTAGIIESAGPNEFVARFAGGYYLFSNADQTTGVQVRAGANAWSSLSDVNSKENFRELPSEEILAKIAAMPVREWNYKTQPAAIRHMGPTAQDFHAAFGLGEDPLRISTIDADGVALAAVKALEARTRMLMDENAALRQSLEELRALVSAPAGGGRR